ncbi:MAG TPA: hypothetical protein VMQ62_02340 [Dongiaceae bacterium]|nr:hypothetical protein [Dongiaceae bacterium]
MSRRSRFILRISATLPLLIGSMLRAGTPTADPPTAATAASDATMNHCGAAVMGFDQEKTAHHFFLYADGGAIEVAVKDPADANNRDAIRAHLPHIAAMFGEGNFEAPMLVHGRQDVPGIATLARLKARVAYVYRETAGGGRVTITTTDPEALKAVHEFLTFQIRDHATGDPLTLSQRAG